MLMREMAGVAAADGVVGPTPTVDVQDVLLRASSDLDHIVTVRDEGGLIYVNDAAERVTGYTIAELRALPSLYDIVVPEQQARVRATSREPGVHEMTVVRKDGGLVELEVYRRTFERDGRPHWLGIARDVTAARSAARELQRRAAYDALTTLPNRALFSERLEAALGRNAEGPTAVILLDLDDFKHVNDTLGHQAGDSLLKELAPLLASAMRATDTVARLGGDEFGVILPGAGSDAAERVARELRRICASALVVDGQAIALGASVGIALFPDHATGPTDLLRAADVAMYAAKRSRSGVAFYSPGSDTNSRERIELTTQLPQAIPGDQLVLHYQPLVSLTSRTILGVEALVRWQHPARGLLMPDEFIPLAERVGMMGQLTRHVMAKALAQYRAWSALGWALPVLVNLTAGDLLDPELVPHVQRLRDEYRLSKRWLKLEITEGAVIADPERAIETLTRLREMGVLTAIDDFGTGYSSLSYLARLPVDAVKIDRSFVIGMSRDPRNATIVRATTDLAHRLGFRVVAEGVEDAESMLALGAMGCDMAQGYAIARPGTAADLERWLAAAPWRLRRVETSEAVA
jgi:diguanylate cyclase (GGDEF)-like protein/PAS domain S-box-containing protein